MIYPWQYDQWRRSIRYLENNHLAHAVLLSGAADIGKLNFCLAYVQRMNCVSPTKEDYACGDCKDCRLFLARNHPDVRLVNVDENDDQTKTDQIKIDDIRELNQFMNLSRRQAKFKIICINNAEHMNVNAANALLKILEEPSDNAVLFLISSKAESLLPTIKSRCQIWKFALPGDEVALNWLKSESKHQDWDTLLSVSGARPLYALALHETGVGEARASFYEQVVKLVHGKQKVTEISAILQNEELGRLVTWLQSWCADLLRCHYEKEPVTLENPDIRRSLHSLEGRVDLQSLSDYMQKLIEFRRFSDAPLNKRLFIEDMLVRCQELFEPSVN